MSGLFSTSDQSDDQRKAARDAHLEFTLRFVIFYYWLRNIQYGTHVRLKPIKSVAWIFHVIEQLVCLQTKGLNFSVAPPTQG